MGRCTRFCVYLFFLISCFPVTRPWFYFCVSPLVPLCTQQFRNWISFIYICVSRYLYIVQLMGRYTRLIFISPVRRPWFSLCVSPPVSLRILRSILRHTPGVASCEWKRGNTVDISTGSLAFTRYCNCQYCVVYIAITGGRGEPLYCAIVRAVTVWGGVPIQRVGAQRIVLIRAQRPRHKTISCIG